MGAPVAVTCVVEKVVLHSQAASAALMQAAESTAVEVTKAPSVQGTPEVPWADCGCASAEAAEGAEAMVRLSVDCAVEEATKVAEVTARPVALLATPSFPGAMAEEKRVEALVEALVEAIEMPGGKQRQTEQEPAR